MGRVESEKWGPRLIDIDILLFSNRVVNQPQLVIPHPFMTQRDFVMMPLLEIYPQFNALEVENNSNYNKELLLNSDIAKI